MKVSLLPVNVLPGVGDVSIAGPTVPVPLKGMVCVDPLTFRALSVKTSDPVSEPKIVGEKLMGSRQDASTANVPGEEEPELTRGQAEATLLSRIKLVEMLGLFPPEGTAKLNAELPTFSSVTVCGLSELVFPTAVAANCRIGGSVKSIL
jgi:hypothetical protein